MGYIEMFDTNVYTKDSLHDKISKYVSKIGFPTAYGPNEGRIAPYRNMEFQQRNYQAYIIMKP